MLSKAELNERVKLYADAVTAMDKYDALKAAIPFVPPDDLIAGSEALPDHVNEALIAMLKATWAQVRDALLYEEHRLAEHALWRVQQFEAGEDV